MQQWIPRTHTLEPKIWGQVGLRQGLYMGLGVFAGIFFLVALAPFGIGPRIVAALMSLAGGATVGFIKIKGLSPERYLFHRLRFALRRQRVGVWVMPEALPCCDAAGSQTQVRQQEALPKPVPAPLVSRPRWATQTSVAPAGGCSECTVPAGPFGMGFHLAALGTMGAAAAYISVM